MPQRRANVFATASLHAYQSSMGKYEMKKPLPSSDPQFASLLALPYAAVKWELLKTAIQLNIFDCLSMPVTSDDVASVLATHPSNTECFLDALVALGCLSKSHGLYGNTFVAERYLTRGKETSLGDCLLFLDGWNEPVFHGGMLRLVKDGPPPPQNMADESLWETGARVSINLSRVGRAQMLASYISALPEFPTFTKMLDLGAGPGVMGIAVAAAHPSLQCVLFDRPAVAGVADEVIAEYGMEGRVETLRGDYMNDPIGDGYDLIMANFTLHFCRDRLDAVVTKIYDAINPGGIFLVTAGGLTNEKTAPEAIIIGWLGTSLQGAHTTFEQDVIAQAMLRAGFVSVHSRIVDSVESEAFGPIAMDIARK